MVILHAPTWDGASQVSKHHLARYWAASGRPVLYVEAPFHALSFATRRGEAYRLWRRFRRGPQNVGPNLWVHVYPSVYPYRAGLPWAGSKWMVGLNQVVARRRLPEVCHSLGFRKPVVMVGSPVYSDLISSLDPAMVVYHCSDDYSSQPTFPAGFAELETGLMDRSDLVICTAEELRRAKDQLAATHQLHRVLHS